MSVGLIWLVAGVGLLVLEVFMPGVFLIWVGLAAIGTGGVVLGLDVGLAGQVVAFGAFAAVAIGFGVRLRGGRTRLLNTAQSGLIGRHARVLQVDGSGVRVRIGDSDWPARLAKNAVDVAVGTELRVVGVDGLFVVLEPDDFWRNRQKV